MDTVEVLQSLKEFIESLLPELDENAWEEFVSVAVVKEVKKGDVLNRPGMVCNNVSYVYSGLIRSFLLVDGKEIVTVFANEGCYFSDYESFLTRLPSKMCTEALEDTVIVDVSYSDLQKLYRSHHQCETIGRLVAENLFIELSNRNYSFQYDTPDIRYEKFLAQYESIVQRVPQYMIASYIGVTPEALSRVRSRLSRKKVAQVG